MIVYIAGPYRHPLGECYVHRHIEDARAVTEELWKMGYTVICPHLNTAHFGGLVPDERFLKGYMEILTCLSDNPDSCVVMLPRWKQSNGARAEFDFAEALGMNIFHWPDDENLLKERVTK